MLIGGLRKGIARSLRQVAALLDGARWIPDRWNKINVRSMNLYINSTERYIRALESWVPEKALERVRAAHFRGEPFVRNDDSGVPVLRLVESTDDDSDARQSPGRLRS